jgi:hypothetical protein
VTSASKKPGVAFWATVVVVGFLSFFVAAVIWMYEHRYAG